MILVAEALNAVHPPGDGAPVGFGDPEMFGTIEKVIMSSKYGRERFKFMLKRVEMMREKMAPSKTS